MKIDKFTERAQEAIAQSQAVLQSMGQTQLDIEHLLIALLDQADGLVPQILQKVSVDPDVIKLKIIDNISMTARGHFYGGPGQTQVYLTPRFKKIRKTHI